MMNTIETLEILPGEGEERTIHQKRVRKECEVCGEPAHYRQTFLLSGTRSNPESSAYRQDDCSYCSDAEMFACRVHADEVRNHPPDGYVPCAQFPATARFAHLFLTWAQQ